jgi:hypothetical protein
MFNFPVLRLINKMIIKSKPRYYDDRRVSSDDLQNQIKTNKLSSTVRSGLSTRSLSKRWRSFSGTRFLDRSHAICVNQNNSESTRGTDAKYDSLCT